MLFFFFQAEDGIRDRDVTGVQTCALPILVAFDSVGFLPEEADPSSIGGLRRARVFAGYAGWRAGQLEAELDEGSWITERALASDVFTEDPDALWADVLRRKGPEYRLMST